MKRISPYFFLVIAMSACLDDAKVELPLSTPQIIIDAVVTSGAEGTMITIGWTAPVGYTCLDSFGNPIRCEPEPVTGAFTITGTVSVRDVGTDRRLSKGFGMTEKRGYVEINLDFQGTPGHEYELEVEVNSPEETVYYQSKAKMLFTPPIDSIGYIIRKGDIGKEDNLVPIISFLDPSEKNYYLFQLCRISKSNQVSYCSNNRVWSYSLIDDTFLPSHVKGLSIDDGASIAKYAEFYPTPSQDQGAQVKMFSVDRTTYLFYKALIEQFNNDGGAYSPTPATPPGNVPGAIGLFRAIHQSDKKIFF